MRLPETVDVKATSGEKKKPLEVVSIYNDERPALKEFSTIEFGNGIEAYVMVSQGSRLCVGFDIPCSELQIVDLLVDGVLRESNVTSHAPAKAHRGKFLEVCACEKHTSGRKGKLEFCQMVVEKRKVTKDISTTSPGFEALLQSAVGTIEVRVLRERASAPNHIKTEQAERGPSFEDHTNWWDISRRVDSGRIAPTYQIGFINGRKTHGSSRKNINRSIEGYYTWATFKFLYRSASDIHAAGFDIPNDPPNLSSNSSPSQSGNSTGNMESLQSAATIAVDKEPTITQKAVPELPHGQIESGSSLMSEAIPMNTADKTTSPNEIRLAEEKLQIVVPGQSNQVVDKIIAASEDVKVNVAMDGQRIDETDKSQNILSKESTGFANRMFEYNLPADEKVLKRKPLLTFRQAAIAISEQQIANNVEECDSTDAQVDRIIPDLSEARKPPENASSSVVHDLRSVRNEKNEKQQLGPHVQQLEHNVQDFENFSPQTILKCSTARSIPSQIKPQRVGHIDLQGCDREVSAEASISYVASSTSQVSDGNDIFQGIQNELTEVHKIPEYRTLAPSSIIRARAGHYMAQSLLVDPNTEDFEREAKAMTNGQGDWRARVERFMHGLAASSKKRATTEDPPNPSPIDQLGVKDSTMIPLPSSLSDISRKRTHDEFSVGADDILNPLCDLQASVSSQNEQRMSLKERRKELAQQKRVKQELLEKAKARADDLRRQVQAMESSQAEAILREELELAELDKEIENTNGEQQALAARLLELNEL